MQHVTNHVRSWSRMLLGLVALAMLLCAADTSHAQPTPNDTRVLQHIQPRSHRALNKVVLGKSAAQEAIILDQRWLYEWTGTTWGHVSQTVYVYQKADRTEEWLFTWTGSVMLNQSRTTYRLQTANTLIELHEEYNRDVGAFYEVDRYTFMYASDIWTGDPLELHYSMVHETKIGDEWRPLERSSYTPINESELRIVVDEWNGEEWAPRDRIHLAATAQGVVQTEETRSGTGWARTQRTTFYGFTIETLYETTKAFMDYFTDYAGLHYAPHLFPNFIAETWDGLNWVPSERKMGITSDPDVGDGLTFDGAVYESFVEGSWVPETRQFTTYRMSDNKAVKSELAVFTGTTWQTTLVETFEHDGMGDMIRATQQVDSGEGLENSLMFVFLWDHIAVGIEDEELPGGYALDPAYPNPFNPVTTIQYRLASAGRVSLHVYDTLGRHVSTLFDGSQSAGTHEVTFAAGGLSSGVFMIRLEAPGFSQTRTVTLLK